MTNTPEILDPCCGGRMWHSDRNNPQVLFGDKRSFDGHLCDGRDFVVAPDQILDFRDLPFEDGSFNLITFDPPHLHTGVETGWQVIKYGKLDEENWQEDMSQGFAECWRVLAKGGTLIFKWNETQIKVSEILACFDQKPIVSHPTTRNLKTHWMVFYKPENQPEQA